ncbi:MAG: hypothetical protein WCL11_04255 [Verrucomicrobiota bacterium]
MTPPFLEIAKDKGPLRTALEAILKGVLVDVTRSNGGVIGLVIPKEADGGDWADQAADILNRHPKCVGLVVVNDDDARLFLHLRSGLHVPFCQAVRFVRAGANLLMNLLDKVNEIRQCRPSSVAMDRTREVIFARTLFRRMEIYSHGGREDITNKVLAPLRLQLQLGESPNLRGLLPWLREFSRNVLKPAKDWGLLGNEIRIAFAQFLKGLRASASDRHAIERLMDIFTQCRECAGAPIKLEIHDEGMREPFAGTNDVEKGYQVLVIDDHWQYWKPFFEEAGKKVSRILGKAEVSFKALSWGNESVAAAAVKELPGYDAVLLDIFLGSDANGLAILDSIRKHYVNVPVILWTSSREIDLPARARLAQGFLFKKTSSIDKITEVLARQLCEGRARRLYPLPGHFFDQSIVNEDNRKCALRFTEYCSKQLDSFHALDDQYFRYFTDHGGRHLFKLLEYLGEMLRPLVDDPEVFSPGAGMREEEILAFYLAVFLHEFGMLRLSGPGEPNWEREISDFKHAPDKSKLPKELALVRALHAVRGMLLLAKHPEDDANHWPDDEGKHQALKRLWVQQRNYVRNSVALITGHHSRLLPLDLMQDEWNHSFEDAFRQKALGALEVSADEAIEYFADRFYSMNEVRSALDRLIGSIVDQGRLARLRKHCAIFRFVDAIDVDHTRNPARFLCVAGRINRFDRRETLKRQVIRKVRIEGGTVHMETNVSWPDVKALMRIVNSNSQTLPEPDELSQWVVDPWRDPGDVSREWRIECHKELDKWLGEFWRNPKTFKAGDVLTKDGAHYTDHSKLLIASLTALSVAWEVLAEYKAIVECGLTEKVRLGSFWRVERPKPEDWANRQKDMLSILFHKEDGLDSLTR